MSDLSLELYFGSFFLYSGNALQSLEKKYEEEKSRAEQLAKYVYVYYTHNLYYKRNINVLITKRKTSSYLLQRKQRIAGRHWKQERTVKKVGDFTIHCNVREKRPSDKYTV